MTGTAADPDLRRAEPAWDCAADPRPSALDRAADALLLLGQVQRAELLAHRAEALRAEAAR